MLEAILLILLVLVGVAYFVQRTSRRQEDESVTFTITTTVSRPREDQADETREDSDGWEGSFWEVDDPTSVSAALRLDYTDAHGNRTKRIVDVRQFGPHERTTLLIGHCRLRDATRTFRADRIRECVDVGTGEIVADVRQHLQALYDASPQRTQDRLRDEEFDTLRVLFYVGKADGAFSAAEKAVVLETCVSITGDTRLTLGSIGKMLTEMQVPTLQAFRLAVGRLAKRGPSVQAVVMAAAERMVATQKAVHAAEAEALEYMRKRWAPAESIPSGRRRRRGTEQSDAVDV